MHFIDIINIIYTRRYNIQSFSQPRCIYMMNMTDDSKSYAIAPMYIYAFIKNMLEEYPAKK